MQTAPDFKNGMAWALFRVCYEAGLKYYDPEDWNEKFPTLEEGWDWFTGLDQSEHGFRRRTPAADGTHIWQRFGVTLVLDINGDPEEELADHSTHPDFEALVAKAEALWASENPEQLEVVSHITDEAFDNELARLAGQLSGAELLSISGVYEALSEHFNNEVLNNLRGGA